MKTKFGLFWICLPGMLLLPAGLRAQFTSTTNNGAFVITGYAGPASSVTIPGTTNGFPVIIGDNAFFYQSTLTNLTIMNGVLDIGSNAFSGCTNLTGVAIPGSVTNIGSYAFNYCPGLTNITISNGVANIAGGAFGLTMIRSIIVPGSVTNIGSSAFESCYELASVTISNGVKSIQSNAFYGCNRITSVLIPGSAASVGVGAFEDCASLTNIAVDGLNPNYASMAGVLFDKTLTKLLEWPGGGNGGLSYVIPGSVTSIGDSAFEVCMLTNVTIPNGVTSLGDSAFSGCTQLPGIAIPGSVTDIGDGPLSYCLKMTNIVVDPANPNYASAGGVLFDKAFRTLIRYPAGNTGSYAISNSVVNIASEAFESGNLTAVTIPESVTNIGDWAFAYSSLTDMTIPGSIGNIGSNVFLNCNYLTNVTILDGVTNIGSWAFYACQGLNTVTIPASVQSIGVFAFDNCPSLRNVYCLGNAPTVVTTPFAGSSWVFNEDPGTVNYLPGTTGWTTNFGGMPTAVWNPKVETDNASFGMKTNQFGFNIIWAGGRTVVVEACTDLGHPDWQPLQTNTLTGGTVYFSDSQCINYPVRFYRLRLPQ